MLRLVQIWAGQEGGSGEGGQGERNVVCHRPPGAGAAAVSAVSCGGVNEERFPSVLGGGALNTFSNLALGALHCAQVWC